MSRILLSITLLLSLTLLGCSNHVQLSGRVTYSDDKTPLEAGTVIFQTETFFARGDIGADGKYILSTQKTNDGLPPGKYQVFVNSAYRYEASSGVETPLITSKFASPETSGLTVDVDASTKTYDFEVDRMPGTKK